MNDYHNNKNYYDKCSLKFSDAQRAIIIYHNNYYKLQVNHKLFKIYYNYSNKL